MASRSKKYYDANPKAKAKKKAYDTKYHSTKARRGYRAKLNKKRRELGIYGKGGKDVSHTADGGFVLEDPSVNRARQGANKKSTKKASKGIVTAKSGLAKWFAQDWVDIGSKKKGGGHKKCGRSGKDEEGRPYPKCVPAAKAARMTASQKESAVRRKRAAGNPGGKPTYVKTFAKQGLNMPTQSECAANPSRQGCGAYNPVKVDVSKRGSTKEAKLSIPLGGRTSINLGYTKGKKSSFSGVGGSFSLSGGTKGSAFGKYTSGTKPFAFYSGTVGGAFDDKGSKGPKGKTEANIGGGISIPLGRRGSTSLDLYGKGTFRGGSFTPKKQKGPSVSGNIKLSRSGAYGTRLSPSFGVDYNIKNKKVTPTFGLRYSLQEGGKPKKSFTQAIPDGFTNAISKVEKIKENKESLKQFLKSITQK